MQSILDTLWTFILALLGLVVTAVAIIEVMARTVLGNLGIQGTPQTVLLFLLLGALLVASFRIFGRLFAVLLLAAFSVYFIHVVFGFLNGALIPVQTTGGTTDI